ncbi:MAG TPA: SAM-dependent methyltransferase [Pseudonocardiaceae bacterium]|nr:SAM-dependent methyltransferase [Pseudonocardiaceae bacterium]
MHSSALWIAAARARESARPDRLFDDPWADRLAGDTGRARLAAQPENRFLPVRTRFFDDVVTSADWATQLVLLGAGMDTRAYRLPLPPAMTVYEIDQPGSSAVPEPVKESVLADAEPVCRRSTVAADLRGDWPSALLAAGFRPTEPTVWLAEGLFFYLSPSTVDDLLAGTAALSESRALLAADTFGTGVLSIPGVGAEAFCTDEPVALLRRAGWSTVDVTEPGQSAANYGRLRRIPDDWAGGPDPTMRTYLIVARNAKQTS